MRWCTVCHTYVAGLVHDERFQVCCPNGHLWPIGAGRPIPVPLVEYSRPQPRSQMLLAIAARDGWSCHLCGARVDPGLRAPDGSPGYPMEATLDHVLPRSEGGLRTPENLRLAHKICNELRGVRPVLMRPTVASG